jgi:predicted TIM-barrel fold metal-dependent hydrolase
MDLDYPVIDFHAHLRGDAPVKHPELRGGVYVKELADLMEPLTRQVAGICGMHFRDPFSRFLYRSINQYAYHEIVRVFEKYTVEMLLDSMTRNHIGHTVVCPIEPFFSNEDVAVAIAPYPDRFSMFVAADPHQSECVETLERLIRKYPIAGIKLNPARAGSPLEERRMWDILGLAQEKDLPVFIHTGSFPFEVHGFDDASQLAPVVAAFPNLSITIAHIGWDQYPTILALAERYHHLSVETSWQPPKVIREAVDKLGAYRVLLGSDFPLLQQSVALDNARSALKPKELEIVAHRNAHRLLGVKV